MKKTAKVVIGANYGDEGKGLMTDYFAAQGDDSLVVRFNGGCQAGHTVTTPDGQRHVFSHLGSGWFAGADTYLSRHYAVNPVLFLKERDQLVRHADEPLLYVDLRAPVTTFFDMLVNQMVEDFRGTNRHGSCGLGFGETIGRQEAGLHSLQVVDLLNTDRLYKKLTRIRDTHLLARCKELGLPDFGQHHHLCTSAALVDAFMQASREFLAEVTVVPNAFSLVGASDRVVFEGAQGLLLDQTRGAFPHVTRSNTGLQNVLDIAQECAIEQLDVAYVTRAYLTRHGAGPLANELSGQPYAGVVDLTNQPNMYQGSLRFAYLDHDLLGSAVREDLNASHGSRLDIRASLAVTCLDQVDDTCRYWANGKLHEASLGQQLSALNTHVLPVGYRAYGPTRTTLNSGLPGN